MSILVETHYLKNLNKMNLLTIILNLVYYFLTKVKNPYPFFGTLILVALMLNTLLINSIAVVYILGGKSNKINELVYFALLALFLTLLYFYAIKRKTQIIEVKPSTKLNFLVAGIFLFTLISFIWCANINREKLSKEKSDILVKLKKESLEGKIRKLFE
jgi:hypothetical protein